ncbi:3619_t:CDS:2, partial [Acaulospora colombiana]
MKDVYEVLYLNTRKLTRRAQDQTILYFKVSLEETMEKVTSMNQDPQTLTSTNIVNWVDIERWEEVIIRDNVIEEVKIHFNDPHNEEEDVLAKEALKLLAIEWKELTLYKIITEIRWQEKMLDDPIRQFVKK